MGSYGNANTHSDPLPAVSMPFYRSRTASVADSAGAMHAALQTLEYNCNKDRSAHQFICHNCVEILEKESSQNLVQTIKNCQVRVTQISLLCSLLSSSYAPIAKIDIYQQLICMVYFIHTYKRQSKAS